MKDLSSHLDYDEFSAPVPGESLTRIPGGSPYEQPPQFADPSDACEYLFDTLVQPRQSARLVTMLKHGATCESIARVLVFTGFATGKWTPDVALLIARPVLYMITAIAERAKSNGILKKYTILNPDYEQDSFMEAFSMFKGMEEPSEAEVNKTEGQIEDKPLGLTQNPGMAGGILNSGGR